MTLRMLKIILVVLVGLQGWFYVAGNLSNWDSAISAVGYVIGQQGHEIYPVRIFPAITSPALVTLALLVIVSCEFLVGAFSMKGAWDMWKARRSEPPAFNASKTFALLGAGTAIVIWIGGFVIVGGGLFQMWQTEVGNASFTGAFIYGGTSALVLLFVNSPNHAAS